MTPQFSVTFLCCSALLMISLDNTIFVNAVPVVASCNVPSPELSECASVAADPTEGNPLYSHSELFGVTATPKDVEAFKYYCINDLMVFVISDQLVSYDYQEIVSTAIWHLQNSYYYIYSLVHFSVTCSFTGEHNVVST